MAAFLLERASAQDLMHYFRDEKSISVQLEKLPFAKEETLALRWGTWLIRVCYKDGERVKDDSLDIYSRMISTTKLDISNFDRRIRIVFGTDDERRHTNQIIQMIDFLGSIDGVVIYDPEQNDYVNLPKVDVRQF
jgi:hypothetical protein